ncbi:hypothetical protein [Pedobacter sp.]
MKQEALFKKLGNILAELNDQYQFLAQNPDQLSELELELFLANANFLADHIQIIKKLNLVPQALPHLPAAAEPITDEMVVDNEVSDELHDVQQVEAITFADVQDVEPEPAIILDVKEPAPLDVEHEKEIFRLDEEPTQTFEFILNSNSYSEDDRFDFEEKGADELFDRPLSEEEELILAQKRRVKENLIRNPEELEEDEIGPEPFLVHKEELPIVAPIVQEPVVIEAPKPAVEVNQPVVPVAKVEENAAKPTLNDILAGKNTSTRLNETSGSVITDLKAAINLNDKLLYIKDLFNGYNLAYAEAIDIANKMPNFDAADNFFQKNYAVKNNWAEKQATVDKFYLLLNRRFKD